MPGVEYTHLGPAPCDEPRAHVSELDFRENNKRECEQYIQGIRNKLGPEPEGATLGRQSSLHEFGFYSEVVCAYDPTNQAAAEYARRAEKEAPTTWEECNLKPCCEVTDKVYNGVRTAEGCKVTVTEDGVTTPLNPRYDLRNHSPDGYEFGYAGSGPAQLSLAICADAAGDDKRALATYQDVKRKVVARIEGDQFSLTQLQVLEAVKQAEQDRGVGR